MLWMVISCHHTPRNGLYGFQWVENQWNGFDKYLIFSSINGFLFLFCHIIGQCSTGIVNFSFFFKAKHLKRCIDHETINAITWNEYHLFHLIWKWFCSFLVSSVEGSKFFCWLQFIHSPSQIKANKLFTHWSIV